MSQSAWRSVARRFAYEDSPGHWSAAVLIEPFSHFLFRKSLKLSVMTRIALANRMHQGKKVRATESIDDNRSRVGDDEIMHLNQDVGFSKASDHRRRE